MIYALIVACEALFWVFIGVGLMLRYPLARPRAGLVTLALVPVVDAILLVAVAIDLRLGATAALAHLLAAFYLGFSLAYGHRLIAWADRWFAYRYAAGPRPARLSGAAYTRVLWGDVGRSGMAVVIASGVIWALTWWADAPERTVALASGYTWAALIVAVEVVVALSYTIWPRR